MTFRALALVLLLGVAVPVVGASAAGGPSAVGPPPPSVPWAAPLSGDLVVARPFEAPAHRYGPGHRGADLAAPASSPVLAAGDGVVVFAGMVAGRPVVSVDHADGLRTTYEPVDPAVGAGQAVRRGEPIGTLLAGHPGCPAACLHWGLRRGEDYLDPLSLLRPPRVRLLPLGPVLRAVARPAGSSSGRSPPGRRRPAAGAPACARRASPRAVRAAGGLRSVTAL